MNAREEGPLVSVLVPVYNVENFLERSIKSVLSQTLSDIELILVNDGSTDSSGDICDEFARDDKRVRVIHKENEGFYSARNVGLRYAKGEYIYFMDSDDWIEDNLLEVNYNLGKKYNAEVVLFGHYRDNFKEDSHSTRLEPYSFDVISGNCSFSFFNQLESIIGMAVWQLLIKKEVIDALGLSFPSMKRETDMYFLINLYTKLTGNIVFNDNSYYHHLIIRTSDKINKESFVNHKKVYRIAFAEFNKQRYKDHARSYLLYLLITWFAHSVPNNIIADKSLSILSKFRLINKVVKDPEIQAWVQSFSFKDTQKKYIKALYFLLNNKQPLLLFMAIYFKRILFNNLNYTFRS